MGAEGVAEEFADVSALLLGDLLDLLGEVFGETDGEDAGAAGAWIGHTSSYDTV